MTNPGSFEVHLQSLADFAWDLEGQLEALRLTHDRLSALGEKVAPLGGFPEALSLGDRHRRAAQEMAVLMESVQHVLGFAAGVTRAVATNYAESDERAAAALRQGVGLATPASSIVGLPLNPSPPLVAPPPMGGTVYYSTQYRTPDRPDVD